MDPILNNDEFTEVESRYYLNPQTGLDRQNAFIQNLRDTQAQQNQQIAKDTYNLGSALPSAQGGLGTNTPSNMGYFTSRLQTPQTTSAVANLRATAQATALNQALQNEQEIWKKRYQDAYRAYQKRMNDKANTPQNPYANVPGDEPEYESTSFTIDGAVPGIAEGQTVANFVPDWDDPDNSVVTGYTYVPYGEDYKTNYTSKPIAYSSYIGTGANITRNYKDDSGHWVLEYRLPSGKTTTTKMGETLKRGSDGGYYVYNRNNNTYTYVGE